MILSETGRKLSYDGGLKASWGMSTNSLSFSAAAMTCFAEAGEVIAIGVTHFLDESAEA